MKKQLLVVALCLFGFVGIAQKVDLDRFSFDYAHLKMPREYVEPDKRTFGVRVDADRKIVAPDDIYDRVRLNGYKLVEANPTVGVRVYFNSFLITGAEMKERMEEVKDKEGKVTSRKYFYLMRVSYRSEGGYSIKGPSDTDAQKPKEQEKAASTNRFLQKVESLGEASRTAGTSTGTYSGTYDTREFSSSQDAREYYRDNQRDIKDAIVSEWVRETIKQVNGQLSTRYGFDEVRGRDHLWILDSKTHPEYAIQQDAIKAVKTLMATMDGHRSIATLTTDLEPVMGYLQDLKTKYKADDKNERKIRYSAYYNLACLYYYLDQPEKMIEEAKGLILNDYDTRDGRKFMDMANDLRADLDRQKTTTRHFD
jgi:hypothetical protein